MKPENLAQHGAVQLESQYETLPILFGVVSEGHFTKRLCVTRTSRDVLVAQFLLSPSANSQDVNCLVASIHEPKKIAHKRATKLLSQ